MLFPNEIEVLIQLSEKKELGKEAKQALFEADQPQDVPTGKECEFIGEDDEVS